MKRRHIKGSVELVDGSVTVGPDGRVRANLQARHIVVQGRVDGNLYPIRSVELQKSASFVGDIYTSRIAIEDGTSFFGRLINCSPSSAQWVFGDVPPASRLGELGKKTNQCPNRPFRRPARSSQLVLCASTG